LSWASGKWVSAKTEIDMGIYPEECNALIQGIVFLKNISLGVLKV